MEVAQDEKGAVAGVSEATAPVDSVKESSSGATGTVAVVVAWEESVRKRMQ
jgi:hypothetical protein